MNPAVDILMSALRNEIKVAAYYTLAAEVTTDDEARMLFLEMVDEEEGHARALVTKFKGAPALQGFDVEAYVKELETSVDATLKRDESNLLLNGTMKQVLERAIEMEDNARVNYQSLMEHAETPEIKAFCEEQAREEEQHRLHLVRLLESLDMEPEDRPGL